VITDWSAAKSMSEKNALFTAMTRKDEPMDWKQIETKWAEMARRVCADARCGESIDSAGSEFLASKGETPKNVVAKQNPAVNDKISQKRQRVLTR
jgi:hypothetical protein